MIKAIIFEGPLSHPQFGDMLMQDCFKSKANPEIWISILKKCFIEIQDYLRNAHVFHTTGNSNHEV